MLRILIHLGMHGRSHNKKNMQVLEWMHDNGLGA